MSYLLALGEHREEADHIMAEVFHNKEDWLAEDISTGYGTIIHKPESHAAVLRLEERLGVRVPEPLRDLYLQHGAFQIFDEHLHRSVRVLTIDELLKERGGFDPEWPTVYGALLTHGTRREFDGQLNPLQIAALKQYFVFGSTHHRYEDMSFFVFTATGGFATVRYEHDFSSQAWEAEFKPLCEGHLTAQSIDDVLEAPIRASTAELRRRLEQDCW